MTPRFVQIHFISSWPGALLNRDDAGMAKRLPFGGAVRTRVSSQCLKRHWRVYEGEGSLAELAQPDTVRSRVIFEKLIAEPLVKEGYPEEAVRSHVAQVMVSIGLKDEAKATKKDAKASSLAMGQMLVLGRPEVTYLLSLTREMLNSGATSAKEAFEKVSKHGGKDNLQALVMGAGLSGALFGRMVTSDKLAQTDAAVHVAHAFTVHVEEVESDYFSAIDDLVRESGEKGSGHIGNVELTSGLYYGYVVIDVPLLVSNLTGTSRKDWLNADRNLAARVAANLTRLIATVTPGAKLGSTAAYTYASTMLVELGSTQPRTLANAFQEPVSLRGNLMQETLRALTNHVTSIDAAYGRKTERHLISVAECEPVASAIGATPSNMDTVCAWVEKAIREAK
jgi:CRISPR system Cascade subunit CasC